MQSPDPEKTQLAPTEPCVTPPTVPAFGDMPTEPCVPPAAQGLAERVDHLEYRADIQEHMIFQQQANEISQQPAALGVAGGGFLLTMDTITVAVSKEVMIFFLLLAGLLLAFWIYCHYSFKGAPAIA